MPVTKIRGNTQIIDGTILNAQIDAAAAIATSKLAEGADFIKRTGTITYTANQSMGGNKITVLGDGTAPTDAVNKQQLDNAVAGLDYKPSCRAATTANITLSGTQTIDGVVLVANDRVLVKNQTTGSANGIYLVAAGAWTRVADFIDSTTVTANAAVFIEEGTTLGDTGWVLTNNGTITVGTTALTFAQFTGGTTLGGAGLLLTGNTLEVQTADTSMTINADSIQVRLAANSQLQIATGLKVTPTPTFTNMTLDDGAGTVVLSYNSGDAELRINKGLSIEPANNSTGIKLWDAALALYGIILPPAAGFTSGLSVRMPTGVNITSGVLAYGGVTPMSVGTDGRINIDPAVLMWKAPCRVATTANVTQSGTQTIDGIAVAVGERVLCKNQTTGSQNGIWIVATGSWTRATDMASSSQALSGLAVIISEGTVAADTMWFLSTNDPITLAVTALTFTQFTGGGLASGNFVDRETPAGTINGSNVTFTLANTPTGGSEHLYLNGILQDSGAGNDYTISGLTITYLTAPVSGDKLRCSYRK